MPIKPPNAPDFHCMDCDHLFREYRKRRLFPSNRKELDIIPPKCPKCGSHNVGRLLY
jgi:Zn finger protein HypA/HybF involved in hydrogenase expression